MEENKIKPAASKPKQPPKPLPPRPQPPKPSIIESASEAPQEEKEEIKTKNDSSYKNKEKSKKTKEKPQKVKTEKVKQPKTKIAKFKIALIVVCVALVLTAGAFITNAVLINIENNKKLETPVLQVTVLKDSVFLESNKIEKATKYEFVVISESGETPYLVPNPTFELPKEANQPGEFSFKVRVHGKGAGALSDFSKVKTLKNLIKLGTPNVNIHGLTEVIENNKIIGYKTNDDLMDDKISWQKVEDAIAYEICYGVDYSSGEAVLLKETYTPENNQETTITRPLYPYYSNNGAGLYRISVVAIPANNTFYTKSDECFIQDIEHYKKQDKVEDAKFSVSNLTLSFKIKTTAKHSGKFDLLLLIKGQEYSHKIFEDKAHKEESNGYYIFTLSLNDIENILDVSSITIKTTSDGAYYLDSDVVNVQINN